MEGLAALHLEMVCSPNTSNTEKLTSLIDDDSDDDGPPPLEDAEPAKP
jgi:hypothetical protein